MFKLKQRTAVLIYEILTQAIIVIGVVREWLCKTSWCSMIVRKDRTFKSTDLMYTFQCCDCGGEHKVWYNAKEECMQPIRPRGYTYRLRFFCRPPSKFEAE